MNPIEVKNLTKDYGHDKGIFDVTFSVREGEIFGFLGPNGAGKTTTIRHLMGFIRPDRGKASILGLDCFRNRDQIQGEVGYLPGEVALMDEMTGIQFLQFIARMKGIKDESRMKELIKLFELDPRGKIRKMSKGMKQKLGIVCAFMSRPKVLLLDEPSSGLDPLMQNRFIDLVLEEKKRGATILLSSHIFEEVERTCDKAAFIREGRLVACKDMEDIRKNKKRIFVLYFAEDGEKEEFLLKHQEASASHHHVNIPVAGEVDAFLKELAQYKILDMRIKTLSLEELFLQYYEEAK